MSQRKATVFLRIVRPTILGLIVATGFGCASSDALAGKRAASPALQEPTSADEAFLAAREAFSREDTARLDKLATRLEDHPLAGWVQYWRLRLRLADRRLDDDASLHAQVERQIAHEAGSLAAEWLRRDWMAHLARRGQWQAFEQHYALALARDDDQTRCWHEASRLSRGEDPEPSRQVLAQVRDFNEGCAALLDRLVRDGALSHEQIWSRLVAALEQNASGTIKRLGAAMGLEGPALELAIERPLQALSRRPGRELSIIALVRLGRQDLVEAQHRLETSLPAGPDRAFVAAQLAASAMRKLDPQALALAREGLQSTQVGDETLAWMARAALRSQDWALLATIVGRMSPALRNDPVWVYWLARCELAQGHREPAESLLRSIAGQHHFYGQLAGEELGQLTIAPPKPPAPTAQEHAEAEANPGFARALVWYRLGLRPEGNREWNFQLRGLNDRQLLAAADFACRQKLLDRCVNTADRTVAEHDFSLRFISPFLEQLRPVAVDYGLDTAWVYGLIRQESRFIMDARSTVGAQGLMQMMPATAQWVARKLGVSGFRVEQLHDLGTNLRFGSFYLKSVLDDLEGSPVLASAGYNAGPNRPRAWRSTLTAPVEGAVFAEIIPFNETRDYVKKVLSNATYYAALFTGQPQSLKQRLGQIAPRSLASSDLP
jgi:soluble lytic murein transglycosylase